MKSSLADYQSTKENTAFKYETNLYFSTTTPLPPYFKHVSSHCLLFQIFTVKDVESNLYLRLSKRTDCIFKLNECALFPYKVWLFKSVTKHCKCQKDKLIC